MSNLPELTVIAQMRSRIAVIEGERDHLQRGFNAALETIQSYDQGARIMELTDRIAELEAERDALAAKVDEAQNAAVTLSLKLGTAETRITELEAALREIAALKVGPGMIGPLFSAGMSAGFSAARLIAEHGLGAQSDRDCGHGQVVQNGCPCCEKKIGYPLEDDSQSDAGADQ